MYIESDRLLQSPSFLTEISRLLAVKVPKKMRGNSMDQSVTRTQYDPGTIRKFKRMSCVAALLIVLLLLRGDCGCGVERSAASPVAKSIDVDAASRDATRPSGREAET